MLGKRCNWKITKRNVFGLLECGNNILPSSGQRIIGALNNPQFNEVGHWPWMASIGHIDNNNRWQHRCGATLISDRHFLTAAHCVNHIE